MARTLRFARGGADDSLAVTRLVRERNHRPWSKAFKKSFHHRARRAAQRYISGQLQEAL